MSSLCYRLHKVPRLVTLKSINNNLTGNFVYYLTKRKKKMNIIQ